MTQYLKLGLIILSISLTALAEEIQYMSFKDFTGLHVTFERDIDLNLRSADAFQNIIADYQENTLHLTYASAIKAKDSVCIIQYNKPASLDLDFKKARQDLKFQKITLTNEKDWVIAETKINNNTHWLILKSEDKKITIRCRNNSGDLKGEALVQNAVSIFNNLLWAGAKIKSSSGVPFVPYSKTPSATPFEKAAMNGAPANQ